MKRFHLKDRSSVEAISEAMRNKELFTIVTDDKDFNPLGYDSHSAEVWIGAVGGGFLMTIGSGAIYLAFRDPEPTSRLGLLVGGGIAMALAGGALIMTVLVTRTGYTSAVHFNRQTGQYEWTLRPR